MPRFSPNARLTLLAVIVAFGPALPGHAQTTYTSEACAGLATPMVGKLAEAQSRLEKLNGDENAQEQQSRLLSELLSDGDTQKAISTILKCLAGEGR